MIISGQFDIFGMVEDLLAVQVSNVASESAFNAGGCVIDPFRSRPDHEMVKALTKKGNNNSLDWVAATKKG